jgi:hypothetical protein
VVNRTAIVQDTIPVDSCKCNVGLPPVAVLHRAIAAKTGAEIAGQVLELASLFRDTIFVIKPNSLPGTALSG